mmetsp:Transcript_7291/g.8247  ORF Transcript_7291/g.8247 Transcript_7291/m.8247 type:complete len:111 (+) Transcript_7291:244-576(+)
MYITIGKGASLRIRLDQGKAADDDSNSILLGIDRVFGGTTPGAVGIISAVSGTADALSGGPTAITGGTSGGFIGGTYAPEIASSCTGVGLSQENIEIDLVDNCTDIIISE